MITGGVPSIHDAGMRRVIRLKYAFENFPLHRIFQVGHFAAEVVNPFFDLIANYKLMEDRVEVGGEGSRRTRSLKWIVIWWCITPDYQLRSSGAASSLLTRPEYSYFSNSISRTPEKSSPVLGLTLIIN